MVATTTFGIRTTCWFEAAIDRTILWVLRCSTMKWFLYHLRGAIAFHVEVRRHDKEIEFVCRRRT